MKLTIPKIMVGGTPSDREVLLPLPTGREGWRIDASNGVYQLSFDYRKHLIVIFAPDIKMQHDIVVSYHQYGVKSIQTEKVFITNDTVEGIADTINHTISVCMGNGLCKRPPAKSVKKKARAT